MSRKRLLFVGLDAADADLIEQWSRQGAQHRADEGAGRIVSHAHDRRDLHVSAWPSIFTGTEPDQHGLYHAYVTHQATRACCGRSPIRPFPFLGAAQRSR